MAAEIDLVVTEEQQDLRDTLREFFAEQAPLERLHEPHADLDHGSSSAALSACSPDSRLPSFDRKVWAGVAELGLPAMLVPEEYGGLGQTGRESWVMFTEAGRGLYGGPLLAGVAATHALLLADDPEACAAYLPGIAEGTTVATVAAAETGPFGWSTPDDAAGTATATRAGDGWTVSGEKTFVLAGDAADLILVPAATDDGPTVFAVSDDGGRVSRTELATLDLSRPLSTVRFDEAPARPVGAPGDAGRILDATLDRVLVAVAAEQAGGAEACLDRSVAYAKTRTQFDQPIAAFQAVAHELVDMLGRVERARATAQYAAAAQAAGSDEFAVAARVAAAYCGRAFREVTTATIHVHGGTGFTWEHDAHLYHRRAWTTEHLFGTAGIHHAAVADRLGL